MVVNFQRMVPNISRNYDEMVLTEMGTPLDRSFEIQQADRT